MQPSESIVFLHITDTHFSISGTELGDRDFKDKLKNIDPRTKEESFKQTLVEFLKHFGDKKISAILLTGDYDSCGPSGGMVRLREILKDVFKEKGVPPIVVVPGNHDIVQWSEPSSSNRYEVFTDCWRGDNKYITPYLDGVDDIIIDNDLENHCLVNTAQNNKFIVIPINSCNWSQSKLEYRKDCKEVRETLIKAFTSSDSIAINNFQETLDKEFGKLLEVDAAYVSDNQFIFLQKIIKKAEDKAGEGAIKIALIHHHLLPVNSKEEHKIFSDIINLGKLRQFLRDHGFSILLHGHKHNSAVYVDHIYQEDCINFDDHEILVISGGTINSNGKDIFRIIELESLPYAPLCKISNVSMVKPGQPFINGHVNEFVRKQLWRSKNSKEPIIVSGKNINEVYERTCQLFGDSKTLDKTVICYVEFYGESKLEMSPPVRYQRHSDEDKNDTEELTRWFNETVKWWQLPISKIEARIPYIHGTRLYRYGGTKNQIDRIVKLLKNAPSTSKAIAVLLDPIRDFNDDPAVNTESFASFCFVQFKVHNKLLECIAYYRAQEFCKWWPVNVAELRKLQLEVGGKLKSSGIKIGGITTITGDARIEENVSPTQVAVPIIDQWLDSYPQKISAIAHAILWPNSPSTKPECLVEWHKCFDDIKKSTIKHSDEGIPIAIEGLEQLKFLLKEFSGGNPKHDGLIAEIRYLLNANKQFLGNEKNEDAFDIWSKQVNEHVNNIKNKADELARELPEHRKWFSWL